MSFPALLSLPAEGQNAAALSLSPVRWSSCVLLGAAIGWAREGRLQLSAALAFAARQLLALFGVLTLTVLGALVLAPDRPDAVSWLGPGLAWLVLVLPAQALAVAWAPGPRDVLTKIPTQRAVFDTTRHGHTYINLDNPPEGLLGRSRAGRRPATASGPCGRTSGAGPSPPPPQPVSWRQSLGFHPAG